MITLVYRVCPTWKSVLKLIVEEPFNIACIPWTNSPWASIFLYGITQLRVDGEGVSITQKYEYRKALSIHVARREGGERGSLE